MGKVVAYASAFLPFVSGISRERFDSHRMQFGGKLASPGCCQSFGLVHLGPQAWQHRSSRLPVHDRGQEVNRSVEYRLRMKLWRCSCLPSWATDATPDGGIPGLSVRGRVALRRKNHRRTHAIQDGDRHFNTRTAPWWPLFPGAVPEKVQIWKSVGSPRRVASRAE
jgi:hypothetical protein